MIHASIDPITMCLVTARVKYSAHLQEIDGMLDVVEFAQIERQDSSSGKVRV